MTVVGFYLDPCALKDRDLDEVAAFDMRIFGNWKELGVLLQQEGGPSLTEVVQSLPDGLSRKSWLKALENRVGFFRRETCSLVLPRVLEPEDDGARGGAAPRVPLRLVLARRGTAPARSDEESEGLSWYPEAPEPPVECIEARYSDVAEAWRNARMEGNSQLHKGTPVDDIWNQQIRPLATHARRIVIVDRYAAQNAWSAVQEGRSVEECGLWQFARRVLQEEGPACEMCVVTAWPRLRCRNDRGRWVSSSRPVVPQELERAVTDIGRSLKRLEPLRSMTLSFRLAPDRQMQHDRYIRFDHWVLDVGIGLGILESERNREGLRQTTTVGMRLLDGLPTDALTEDEEALARRPHNPRSGEGEQCARYRIYPPR